MRPTVQRLPVLVLTALALGATLAACDDDNGKTTAPTTTVAPTSTSAPGTDGPSAEAVSRLLAASDIGTDWTALAPSRPEPTAVCPASPDAALSRLTTAAPSGATATYRSTSVNPVAEGPLKMVETVYVSAEAAEWYAAAIDRVEACLAAPWTEAGRTNRVVRRTAPSLGDESASYLLTTTEPATATTAELTTRSPGTIVLVGDAVVEVFGIDTRRTGNPPRLSDADFDRIAARAVELSR